nr:ribonuclease H-like domain-containing protein [Tanacetum cinerariifolium]
RTGLKPVNTVRTVNPKLTRRSFQRRTTYNNRNLYQKVYTAKGKVNTARPNSAVLNAVKENKGKAIKASAYWVWRPIKLDSASIILKKHTYIDARGYVAFRGGAKGGKITDKGIIRAETKDETSRILKSFLNEIENIVDKKVKIIRCDNGTEFKNRVMNEFYEEKDHLEKFDGKSDKRFFVGYSINSKAFRVYNSRTRKVEEILHINFLENKPIIVGDGPKWLFDIDALTESTNYVPVIAGTKSNDFAGKGASFDADSDGDNKDNDGPCKESEIDNQKRHNAKNNTKDVHTTGPSINTASLKVNTVKQSDDFFGADNDMKSLDGVESSVQTRRVTVTTDEQGFICTIYEEKTHEDLHTCLFACFLSQDEPKRITLKDLAWVEAMQEELLQFPLQAGRKECVQTCLLTPASWKSVVKHYVKTNSSFIRVRQLKEHRTIVVTELLRSGLRRKLDERKDPLSATGKQHDSKGREGSFLKAVCRYKQSELNRKDSDAPIIEDWVSDDEEETVEKQEVKPSINRINFVKATTDNNPRETVKNGEQPK